jgi:hypothetical protein
VCGLSEKVLDNTPPPPHFGGILEDVSSRANKYEKRNEKKEKNVKEKG